MNTEIQNISRHTHKEKVEVHTNSFELFKGGLEQRCYFNVQPHISMRAINKDLILFNNRVENEKEIIAEKEIILNQVWE